MLRATTAYTFSTSQLPKVLRDPGVLYILTCKCASRHNGVQFFISHLASWLRTRRFSEPTFRPSGASKSLEKHSVSRLSYLFAHLHLLSSDSFSSTLLSSNLSLLSASALLCFSSVHIVGSLTSKLPSTTTTATATTLPGYHATMLPRYRATTLPCYHYTIHYTTLQLQLQMQLNNRNSYDYHYTTAAPHHNTSHYITLHYTTRPYATLQYTTLHHTTPHHTTFRSCG